MLEDTLRAYVLDHKGRGLIALRGIRLQQQWEREDEMRATYPFVFRDEGT